MSGNVYEQCEDDCHDSYTNAPSNGAAWVHSPRDSSRVVRGGDWHYFAQFCRSASRNYYPPESRYSSLGLRVVRTP